MSNIPQTQEIPARYKGIVCIIFSALCFALMSTFVRLSGNLPTIQKSFFRNLIAFFIALAALAKNGTKPKVIKGNLKFLFARAIFGTIGILCNFYAVDHLVLSDASMLNKMSPFFAILFSFIPASAKLKILPLPKTPKIWYNKGIRKAEKTAPER